MSETSPVVGILVVDDQQPMRKTIAFILRQAGFHHLDFAENGEEAWKSIALGNVDLVLLDWNMPRMSGLTLLERIRGNPVFRDLPVVMITAEANEDHVLTAIHAGVTDYIVKPFTPGVLLKKVDDVLRRFPPVRRPVVIP